MKLGQSDEEGYARKERICLLAAEGIGARKRAAIKDRG
jgi:hypothetical protein